MEEMKIAEEVVIIDSDDSDDSVVEIEPPRIMTPPVFDIVEDDIILNTLNVLKNNNNNKCNNKRSSREALSLHSSMSILSSFSQYPEISTESDNPSQWTQDMITFYNDHWGNEDDFIVEKIQEKMDKCSSLWPVTQRDLRFRENKKIRSYLKCWNCCQYGHTSNQCREPLHIPKCHMCGEAGHINTNCPNTICLNCGNRMRSFVKWCHKCTNESKIQCSRCNLWGHHFLNCSDNWRRFHLTIGKADVTIPEESPYKSSQEMWCCNCGRQGHNQIHCYLGKNPYIFTDTFPFVTSYENTFNSEPTHRKKGGYFSKVAFKINHNAMETGRRKQFHNQSNDLISNTSLLHKVNSKGKKKKKKKKKKSTLERYVINSIFFQNPV